MQLGRGEAEQVSDAKWCDVGQHAFSSTDIDGTYISITKNVSNQWGGAQPHTQQQDVCGRCAARMGLLGEKARAEISKADEDGS